MSPTANLSGNDAAVLGALFDPEASLQNHARIDLQLRGPYNSATLSQIKSQEKAALLPINAEDPDITHLARAISDLTAIITQYPKYPSAWNNRAQAKRMLYDLSSPSPSDSNPISNSNSDLESQSPTLPSIFSDLAQAITLASPATPTAMTSPANAQVLASAHTHRGFLLWKASRPGSSTAMLCGVEGLDGLSQDRLEELASREFAAGGRYGNQTAQQLAVKTNPYAKLCGSIVREALQKEIKDFYGVETMTAGT